jgi:hypothetical protein
LDTVCKITLSTYGSTAESMSVNAEPLLLSWLNKHWHIAVALAFLAYLLAVVLFAAYTTCEPVSAAIELGGVVLAGCGTK